MKRVFICFLICIILFASGCNSVKDNSSSGIGISYGSDITANSTGSKTSDATESADYKQIFSGEIRIYQISRDGFNLFLQNPSHNSLLDDSFSSFSYPESGEWYITYNTARFPVQKQLIDFVGNSKEIQKYLNQNGVSGEIENMAVFDAPNVPITLWVKTTAENIYITINQEPEDTGYVYRLYSQKNFNEKYACKDCKLLVKGNKVTSENPPKLYYNYADLPLIAVMEALGAQVNRRSETSTEIVFNDKTYLLNTYERTFYEAGNKTDNLLNKVDGGSTFVYSVGNELMVDNTTLCSVLSDMGEKITVKFDTENKVVAIT